MKVSEAADHLLAKGVINQQECDLIKEGAKKVDIEKVAFDLPHIPDLPPNASKAIGYSMLGTLGVGILGQLLSPIINHVKSQMSYGEMIKKTPQLADKDPEQIKDYFNVIHTFSPKAASNPLVAGALVNKMMEFGGVDHKLVQDISAIQSGIEQYRPLQDVSSAAAKSLLSKGKKE